MPKIITSPVKHFPGTVTLSDPLTFPQTFAFEDARVEAKKLGEEVSFHRSLYALLPGVLACVEKWDIQGIANPTRDNFPASPSEPVLDLMNWLLKEITTVYQGENDIPNA